MMNSARENATSTHPNSSINFAMAKSPDPSTSGLNGLPSYNTTVAPLARPLTSQCHIIHVTVVNWKKTLPGPMSQ